MKERAVGLFSRLTSKGSNANNPVQLAIVAPVTGEVVALEATADPVFSSRTLGDGVAIVPADGCIKAPIAGTIAAIFPTAHALAISADDGSAQVMVHIGIDTVRLEGKGFEPLVKQGDHVAAGQPLVNVDLQEVASAGYDATTFVVICEKKQNLKLKEHAAGPVTSGDELIWLTA